MRILSVSPEIQQRLAVVVPIVALLLSLFVVYPAWGRYTALRAQIRTRQNELDTLRATPLPEVGTVPPTADYHPSEPPQFLGQVGALADEAGCRIVGVDASPLAKQQVGSVRAVRARIDLEGRYSQIRDFIFRLARAPRLFVVTDLALTGTVPTATPGAGLPPPPTHRVRASVEIERYIALPTP